MHTGTSRPTRELTRKVLLATFLWDWLGAAAGRVLESHKWDEAYKENVDTIYNEM